MFNIKFMNEVPDREFFYTVEEYDEKITSLCQKYHFPLEKIGESEINKHPIYLLRAGNGKRKLLIWGFPHPNEPVGEMTIEFLIDYIGKNGDFGYTWFFIPNADPDGSKLNEGWFKHITLKNYFFNYYRPAAIKQMEWVFPVKYKNFVWDKPMKETEIMMNAINKIMPDLMYPLHNAGIGGAYFFSTEKFDEQYFTSMIEGLKQINIPLDMSEPEEEFMREMKRPFYYDFGLKDYYEYEVKLGRDPQKLVHGDNSTGYLKSVKQDAIAIKGEVPYFYDEIIADTSSSGKTRKELWLTMLDENSSNFDLYKEICPKIIKKLPKDDLHSFLLMQILNFAHKGNAELKKYVAESDEFKKIATKSEEYDCTIQSKFTRTLTFGQIRRAAIKADMQDIAFEFQRKISENEEFIKKHSNLKIFPIKKLVQTQSLHLFETLNYLERKEGS